MDEAPDITVQHFRRELLAAQGQSEESREPAFRRLASEEHALASVAALLDDPLVGALASRVGIEYWARSVSASEKELIPALRWAEKALQSEDLKRHLVSRLAWELRDATSNPLEEQDFATLASRGSTGEQTRLLLLARANWLRFENRGDELSRFATQALRSFPNDVMLRALRARGRLAARDAGGLADLDAALEAADCDQSILFICLMALARADYLEDQSKRILELVGRIEHEAGATPGVLQEKAFALRRMGRFDEALNAADQAIARAGPADRDVEQMAWQERQTILLLSDLSHQAEERSAELRRELADESARLVSAAEQTLRKQLSSAEDQLEVYRAEARDAVSSSFAGVVEILGLFSAIILFLFAAANITISQDGVLEKAALIAVAAVAILGFFMALRMVVLSKTLSTRHQASHPR